jgi:hypothetical protein
LSTEYIVKLPEEQITKLGRELEVTTRSRKKTEATIQRLEKAKEIAEKTLEKTGDLADSTARFSY